ncbi:MAG: Proteasome subunit beta type-1 [Chaenotheca gracillima]|nr:MAG: Proteasome subunit beta type-1 [Chaenotheca gracillima]
MSYLKVGNQLISPSIQDAVYKVWVVDRVLRVWMIAELVYNDTGVMLDSETVIAILESFRWRGERRGPVTTYRGVTYRAPSEVLSFQVASNKLFGPTSNMNSDKTSRLSDEVQKAIVKRFDSGAQPYAQIARNVTEAHGREITEVQVVEVLKLLDRLDIDDTVKRDKVEAPTETSFGMPLYHPGGRNISFLVRMEILCNWDFRQRDISYLALKIRENHGIEFTEDDVLHVLRQYNKCDFFDGARGGAGGTRKADEPAGFQPLEG